MISTRKGLLIMLLTLTTAAQGQTSEGDYQTIDMRDGLSHNNVQSLLNDPRGDVWAATTEICFDKGQQSDLLWTYTPPSCANAKLFPSLLNPHTYDG